MEIEVTDATGLPEWLQTHVAEGKLDLTKLPQPEDVSGLKTALQKERENVGAYSKLGKPDEIAQRIADLEEKAKGTGKGAEDAQAKLDAMRDEYEGPNGKLTAAEQRFQKLVQSKAEADFKAELAKAGFKPGSMEKIARFYMDQIKFDQDGALKIVEANGKPMIGTGPEHGATLADLAKRLAADESNSDFVLDGGKGGSGKQPGSNGGTPEKTVTRAQWDAMGHVDRATFSKDGGKVTD